MKDQSVSKKNTKLTEKELEIILYLSNKKTKNNFRTSE